MLDLEELTFGGQVIHLRATAPFMFPLCRQGLAEALHARHGGDKEGDGTHL